MSADAWAARLASGARVGERVAMVVAHPDDETLWAGALLGRLRDGLLIHLTDGAPMDMIDAARLGFATRRGYAEARAAELDAALAALGFDGERLAYDLPDKKAALHLDAIVERLTRDLAGAAVVVTHAYEGGHPDHDAAAFAVRRAADRIGVPVVEFASYHLLDGERRFGVFWPDPAAPEHSRPLLPVETDRIERALRAHHTQAPVFGDWRPAVERWRAAPTYAFAAPPPPGQALYDRFGWTLTLDRWREIVLSYTGGGCQAENPPRDHSATNPQDRVTESSNGREMWEGSEALGC